jgi:hypothetical protein
MPIKKPTRDKVEVVRATSSGAVDNVGKLIRTASVWYHETLIPYCESFDLKKLFRIHALWLVSVGFFLTFMPHTILHLLMPKMDHMTHEIYRLYGALNISIGYIVWKLRYIGDGRVVGRLIAETFCVCFALQALVILRAQLTNPAGHDFWHWSLALIYTIFAALYGHIRFVKKIKTFDLPGAHED